jgi:hypothetical protein
LWSRRCALCITPAPELLTSDAVFEPMQGK